MLFSRKSNINGGTDYATSCIFPTEEKELTDSLRIEINQLKDYLSNVQLGITEFNRLKNVYAGTTVKQIALETYCISVSHWRALDFYLDNFKLLKNLNLELTYPTPIFSLCTFLNQGSKQLILKVPSIITMIAEKENLYNTTLAEYTEKNRNYFVCLEEEKKYLETVIEVVEADESLTDAEKEKVIAQMELGESVAENYFPFIMGALGLGALYILTDKKKKK
jgi:hypothetical protein